MTDWYSIPGFSDPMSSISHLVGAIVFLVLAVLMMYTAWPSRRRFWFTLVFAVAAVALLSISFVYHIFQPGYLPRAIMLRLDVAAIFTLIAASFTPIHGILYSGWKRWGVLVPLWTITLLGITLRTIFFESIPDVVGIGIFLAIGWIGALTAYLLYHDYGKSAIRPVVWGGVLYSIGAVINAMQWPIIIPGVWGPHETFHLFVLAALACHWSFIAKVADGTIVESSRKTSKYLPNELQSSLSTHSPATTAANE